MSENIISLRDITIHRGDALILDQISLEISKREFVYLIGKTGSGKTSLLKTLYGILPLEHGQGQVAGFDLTSLNRKKLPLLRRNVGYIFQDYVLLEDRTVKDNLLFALQATGWKDMHRMQLKIDEVLIRVGLRGVEDKMPHQLSGGEQQRVVIARALLNNPSLIISDEATGNLDPETSEEILLLLKNLSHKHGTAVLFATHDYQLIEQFPARVILCQDGKLHDKNSLKV